MKNILFRRSSIALLVVLALTATSCKVGRFVYYNFANITDYKIFPSRTAAVNTASVYHYPASAKPKFPKTLQLGNKDIAFDDFLAQHKTVAFLVIKNDSLHYEKYFSGYNEASLVASFSMAKSLTSILIGCALEDGLIKSVEEPVVSYIPELKNEGMDKVTIKHLLQMTSGIKFNESYINPFGDAATYYYGTNIKKAIYKRKLINQPGTTFSYSSGDTQMLGLVLERALKGKTITAYLEEKIWKPLGMEYDATWSMDREKDGIEKTFGSINARARDFAKLGSLYLHNGSWNGKQIVSKEWVALSTTADLTEGGVPYYKYQWWLQANGSYMAQGILGQYVYVCPAKNLVIVRLGKDYGNVEWENLFASLANSY